MAINFTEDTGTWFYFDDNSDIGGLCLKMPSPDEYEQIQNLTVKPGKTDYHNGIRYETEKTDLKLATKLQARKLILDWKGISLYGTECKCTKENIDKAMGLKDFRSFFADCITKLAGTNKAIEAARLKNLKDSSDGDLAQEEKSAEKSV